MNFFENIQTSKMTFYLIKKDLYKNGSNRIYKINTLKKMSMTKIRLKNYFEKD